MPELRVIKVPMLDTGLGIEAGFESDADLLNHARAEREAMDPLTRSLLEALDERVERAFLFGDPNA